MSEVSSQRGGFMKKGRILLANPLRPLFNAPKPLCFAELTLSPALMEALHWA